VTLFLLPLLSWSQSYPYQRIEGGDTVVVMTKKQGDDINGVFRTNKFTIDSLYVRNGLLVNHVLKYDSTLKESMEMNILLDSILSSETAAYQREISSELKRDKKINKIMGVSWFLFFFLYLL
jgi:hypothetical protein